MNTTTIQTNSQVQTRQSKPLPTPKGIQTTGKSFQELMHVATNKANNSKPAEMRGNDSKANGATQEKTPANKEPTVPEKNVNESKTDADTTQTETSQGLQEGQVLQSQESTETTDNDEIQLVSVFSNKSAMLAVLFGGILTKEGESDEDILRRILENTEDEGAKLAAQMLLEFLAANPGATLDDMCQQLTNTQMPLHVGEAPAQDVLAMFDALQTTAPEMKLPASMEDFKAQVRQLIQEGVLKDLASLEAAVKTVPQSVLQEAKVPVAHNLLEGQAKFQDAVTQAQQLMKGEPVEKRETDSVKLDVEKLQSQVDAGAFLRTPYTIPLYGSGEAKAVPPQVQVDPAEFFDQVHTGLFKGLEGGKQEFVMKLRPEGLGELTVKLAELGGKMTLTIAATTVQTQKLLNAELYNLREVMRPYQVEVEQVVTAKEQASGQFGSQMGQQTFGEHQHSAEYRQQGQFAQGWNTDQAEENREIPVDFRDSFRFTGGLNAYI